MIVVGLEPIETLTGYLSSHQLETDAVVSVNPGTLKVSGTPTLVLVDNKGKVTKQWPGALREREADVEAALVQ